MGTGVGQAGAPAYHGEMDAPRPSESGVAPLASVNNPKASPVRVTTTKMGRLGETSILLTGDAKPSQI